MCSRTHFAWIFWCGKSVMLLQISKQKHNIFFIIIFTQFDFLHAQEPLLLLHEWSPNSFALLFINVHLFPIRMAQTLIVMHRGKTEKMSQSWAEILVVWSRLLEVRYLQPTSRKALPWLLLAAAHPRVLQTKYNTWKARLMKWGPRLVVQHTHGHIFVRHWGEGTCACVFVVECLQHFTYNSKVVSLYSVCGKVTH